MQSQWEKAGFASRNERAKGTAAVEDSKETRTGSAPCSQRRQKTSEQRNAAPWPTNTPNLDGMKDEA
ncbi:C-Myc Promoter-Binding Protein [Manis pentadactyla]|nr:C-Myc Promoter-Binding Protein [Manis pentadactyla]